MWNMQRELLFRYEQNTGRKIRGGVPLQKGRESERERERERKNLNLTKQKYRFHIKKPLPKKKEIR